MQNFWSPLDIEDGKMHDVDVDDWESMEVLLPRGNDATIMNMSHPTHSPNSAPSGRYQHS